MAGATAPRGRSRLARLRVRLRKELRLFLRALPVAVDGYFGDRLAQHAAGIAYRVLFSLAPLAIVLVSAFGLVLRDEGLRADVTSTVVGWLPVSAEGEDTVGDAIESLANPTSALGLLSIVLFAWAATGMMAAIRNGLETALRVEARRPAARGKLVDLLLVVGVGVLVIATIATAFVAQVVTRFADGVAGTLGVRGGLVAELVRLAVPLGLVTVAVMVLYRLAPSRRLDRGDAVAGAVVTAVLFVGISAASAQVYEQVAQLSVVYGSITVALVFLYSVYLYASALLLGAALAAARGRAGGAAAAPVPLSVWLRRAARGLFVQRGP
jgi:membrane protein